MLIPLGITETNHRQPILPTRQISSRRAEDGKHRPPRLVSFILTAFQGKQTGEEGGIVRQTTE